MAQSTEGDKLLSQGASRGSPTLVVSASRAIHLVPPHSVLFGWDGFCVRRICPADELAGVAESNPEMGKSSRTPVLTRGATTGCDFLSSVGFRRRI